MTRITVAICIIAAATTCTQPAQAFVSELQSKAKQNVIDLVTNGVAEEPKIISAIE